MHLALGQEASVWEGILLWSLKFSLGLQQTINVLFQVRVSLLVVGVFVAAHDMKIEWVIVKGVSHFINDPDQPDELWKSFACTMAASLVFNMLNDPVVFKDWPHFDGKRFSA